MSTEATFLKNNQFGSFTNLATLKGFWLDYTDFNQWGNSVYLMDVWKSHLNQGWVTILSWFYFALLVFGLGSLAFAKKSQSFLRQSHWRYFWFFLFTTFIIAGSNPPLAFLYDFLPKLCPCLVKSFDQLLLNGLFPTVCFIVY